MRFPLLALAGMMFLNASAQTGVPSSIYDFKVTALNGGTIDLANYKGKKIMIVNTPEEADFNQQYKQLEALYEQHKDKLVIIGFITNDFQIEPGSSKHPNREKHYPVTFPLAAKVMVRGDNMAPIYQWLTQKQYNHFEDTEIKWDFQKFLIDENGVLVADYDPQLKANSAEIARGVDK